jgi:hypothetical protein
VLLLGLLDDRVLLMGTLDQLRVDQLVVAAMMDVKR